MLCVQMHEYPSGPYIYRRGSRAKGPKGGSNITYLDFFLLEKSDARRDG